jgi:hypothetical protein
LNHVKVLEKDGESFAKKLENQTTDGDDER